MRSILRFFRIAWRVLRASFGGPDVWHRCPSCGIYLLNGAVSAARPMPHEWVESEGRLCPACRRAASGRGNNTNTRSGL